MAISERDRLRLLDGYRSTLDEHQFAIMSELLHNMSPDLTTRQHLSSELALLRGDMSLLGAELRTDMAELRGELRTDMAQLRGELRTEMAQLRSELRTDMAQLRGELRYLRADARAGMADLEAEFKADTSHNLRLVLASQLTTFLILLGLILRMT